MNEELMKNAAIMVKNAYKTGCFEEIIENMTDDYEHHSFWVLEPMRGKAEAAEYYTKKGETIRRCKAWSDGKLVRISNSPREIKADTLYINGEAKHNSTFMICADLGKICVLLAQEIDGEIQYTLAIPTITEDGKLKQLLMTEPRLFNLEMYEE